MRARFQFRTDTGTVAIFDPAALSHRLDEPADWWSVPREELAGLNRGNVMIVALGADGVYEVAVEHGAPESNSGAVSAKLRCVSGRLFVGAGEDIVGDGLSPTAEFGGWFVSLSPGTYLVSVSEGTSCALEVRLAAVEDEAANRFTAPLVLEKTFRDAAQISRNGSSQAPIALRATLQQTNLRCALSC